MTYYKFYGIVINTNNVLALFGQSDTSKKQKEIILAVRSKS